MADKRKTPESPGGGPRRKRVAPTIDLKATEVSDPPADKPAAAAPEPQPEKAPEPATAAGPRSETPPEPAAEPQSKAAASEPPADKAPQAEPEPEAAAPPPPSPPPPSRGGIGAAITGGIIGALIVAALGAGLWSAGYIPSSSSDLPARIATLEKQVQALRNQPPPKVDISALDKSVGALSQRVSKIESELGNLPPTDKAAARRLAALDNTVKSLNDAVTALGKRADAIAATARQAQQGATAAQKAVNDLKQSVQDVATAQKGATPSVAPAALEALQQKVAALETALAGTRDKLNREVKNLLDEVTSARQQIAKAGAGNRATRLALSATALRNAVLSGAPYAAQLAQAKSLGADAKTLAPLERFAQSGLPTRNELANELIKLVPPMRKVAGARKAGGSFLERLQANANKLVRITPVEAPAGNDPSDVLARIEAEAAHADIANALSDLAKLPDNVRAPAKDWIAKAKARQAALAAARSIAANAARALGKG